MRPYRRRHYLVHGLQYRLIAAIMVYFLLALVGVVAVIFAPFVLDFSEGASFTPEKFEVAGIFLKLHERFWPVVLLIAVAIVLHSILISHRIGGPLYRFRKVFSAIAQGDLSMEVRLRNRDYPKAEAEALGQMVKSLRARVRTIKGAGAKLAESARHLSGGVRERQEFDNHLRDLQETLAFFQLDGTPEPHQADPASEPPVGAAAQLNSRES